MSTAGAGTCAPPNAVAVTRTGCKFADKVTYPPSSGHPSPYIPWTEYALDPELLKDGAERRRGAARPGARP